jgi:murein DD-endopeptidase MepM/ murein hydrolase activator NlpD
VPTGDWERDVLRTLRAPVTTGNLRLLRAWQRAEGGHTHNNATYNWLNTTRGKQFPAMNSVGVRQFPDYRTGVAYTADTIIGGYPGIVEALRAGKPYASNYRDGVLADFSKWVSGSRTSRLDYGYKILGTQPRTTQHVNQVKAPKLPKNRMSLASLGAVLDDGDDFWDMVAANPIEFPEMAAPISQPHQATVPLSGKSFQVPTSWEGTHVTDKLGWGTNTAHDFILPAGTALRAPESGKVIRHGSAQGGQSLYFRGDSGRTYWFGHIDNRVPVGRRLRKGQRYANVSADHETPHLHADIS